MKLNIHINEDYVLSALIDGINTTVYRSLIRTIRQLTNTSEYGEVNCEVTIPSKAKDSVELHLEGVYIYGNEIVCSIGSHYFKLCRKKLQSITGIKVTKSMVIRIRIKNV